MKKLLIIGYVWPEPHSSAAGSVMLSLIRLFKNNHWQVIISTPAQKTDFNFDLSSENIETLEIKLNDSSFDKTIEQMQPTAVLFDRFMMEEQFGWRVEEACPNALKILDTEDLQCLRGARKNALKESRAASDLNLNTDLAKREIASIYRCDCSIIISDFEITLLAKHFKIDPRLLVHIPFMIDLKKKDDTEIEPLSYSQRQHFVTIGNLRHEPNWDSVLYLQEIWPLIRKKLPNAELHIYGSYTPPKATALHNPKMGFLIKDRAKCVNDVMKNARVCLSPLRFGAGIKGKFIDAMQSNTPSVTTPIGAEGMTGGHEWPGLVGNTPESIAENAVALYSNEVLWQKKSLLCKPLLNDFYNAEIIGRRLMNHVDNLLENIQSHRQNNFIGAMLTHHTMKSTKYMSKWIEEKNK